MVCAPAANDDVWKVAVAFACTAVVPNMVEFSMNETVPVGTAGLPPVLTVAVSVIATPSAGLDTLVASAVVVTAAPTLTCTDDEVLPE